MELRVGTSVVGPGGRPYRVARIEKAFNPSQPRDERGRWSSSGGAPDGGIPAFLSMTAAHGSSGDAFVLEHGRALPTDADTYVGGTPHECYKNAALAVIEDPALTYVEGYVSVHGVPIHHAWTVNGAGVVRDVTLRDGAGIRGYFGVPIRRDYMMKTLLRAKVYGILTHDKIRQVLATDPDEVVFR